MWRDADTEARDLKSNAAFARHARDQSTSCEGAEDLALRALAAALRVRRDFGGCATAPTRTSRYARRASLVNTKRCDELPRPSHKCDLELRGGVVKAAARRVERSESLDDAEHSSILIIVWPVSRENGR
jgi:hypothetical protein